MATVTTTSQTALSTVEACEVAVNKLKKLRIHNVSVIPMCIEI